MPTNKIKPLIIFSLMILVGVFSYTPNSTKAADSSNEGASDAIAIRILPNPNLYSINRWYESRGFKGSPQALTVDGYEAIRDGRTVYVNAANIDKDPPHLRIYNNIYIISYNQDPSPKTVDILGQIISRWKFNTDIDNDPSTCVVSANSCASDTDCGPDQKCELNLPNPGDPNLQYSCQLKTPPNCLIDSDCPTSFFCNSLKARIIRDVKRVGQVEELKEALAKYKQVNGRYPTLDSGSYIAGVTVSTWPSWNQVFLANLGIPTSLTDPINRLTPTDCDDNIDHRTNWSEGAKLFCAANWYDPANDDYIKLPDKSYAWSYRSDPTGSNYQLCSPMESRFGGDDYYFNTLVDSGYGPNGDRCIASDGSSINMGGDIANTPPVIVTMNLDGITGQEYNGYIMASDAENNALTWSVASQVGWTGWRDDKPPILKDTNNPNQKRLYSEIAGNPITKDLPITITDSQGSTTATSVPITITNPAPFIEAEDGEYLLSVNVPFSYEFFISDNNFKADFLDHPEDTIFIGKIPPDAGDPNLFEDERIEREIIPLGFNKYRVSITGEIPVENEITENVDVNFRIKITDNSGNFSTKQVTIRLLVDKPILNFDCPTTARVGKPYSCFLGKKIQNNHDYLDYTLENSPGWLEIATSTPPTPAFSFHSPNPKKSFLSRLFSRFINIFKTKDALSQQEYVWGENTYYRLEGTPLIGNVGTSTVKIKATNSYGTSATKEFSLTVNTYCGDNTAQTPNSEFSGGYYNDGYEDCDGEANVATTPGDSNVNTQYGCRTEKDAFTPYPIPNNNYCIFKAPDNGGGFLGDGLCQLIINGEEMEEPGGDCLADCGPCVPSCVGKECGFEGCGTGVICGSCGPQEVCNNNNQCVFCAPQCEEDTCGESGCGYDCSCDDGKVCIEGPNICAPLNHWVDGTCNSEYGENCDNCVDCFCDNDEQCENVGEIFECAPIDCTPDCNNKKCGDPDGCDGTCNGTCDPGNSCKPVGGGWVCQSDCVLGQCGGFCGNCADPEKVCSDNGFCVPHCGDGHCQKNNPYFEKCSDCETDCGCVAPQQCAGGICKIFCDFDDKCEIADYEYCYNCVDCACKGLQYCNEQDGRCKWCKADNFCESPRENCQNCDDCTCPSGQKCCGGVTPQCKQNCNLN